MHLDSFMYCQAHEAQIVFSLVAHLVLCLRLSQYFFFLKNTETTVFYICFGNVSDGLGLWEPEDTSGVCSHTWVRMKQKGLGILKEELVGNEEQKEWWKREVVEEGLGNYTVLSSH